MSQNVISPAQLHAYAGGIRTVSSPESGWDGVSVQGFRYSPSDVDIPAITDYMIVAHRRGINNVNRFVDGRWSDHTLGPGSVALLSRSEPARWVWDGEVDAVSVFLSRDELSSTCRQMYDREVSEITLHDSLSVDDPALHRASMVIAAEAAQGGAGSRLLVESLATEIGVHILRRHADVRFREADSDQALSAAQLRLLQEHVRLNLAADLSLQTLADTLGMSRFHFARRFRASTGQSPHVFVLGQRVDRAQVLLRRTRLPLHEVAARCGFADSSHMSRVFRQRLETTPGRYRTG